MEHRWGTRVSLNERVTLHAGQGVFTRGRILNASRSGALIRTDIQLPLLARVTLELQDGDTEFAPCLVEGYVTRHCVAGLALEWTEFSPPAIAALLCRTAAKLQTAGERNPRPDNRRCGRSLRGGSFEQHPWR
jgi:hypothetical protein